MIYMDISTISKKYSIIYADPPWSYEVGKESGLMGIAESHYPTMTLEEIKKLPIQILGKDAVLFLWATFPKIETALEVMRNWGFEYRTVAFVWIKVSKEGRFLKSVGWWTRSNAEVCLLGVKGEHPKRKDNTVSQIVMASRREHSRKPDGVRDRIVQLMGDLPRIELFANQAIEGWDVWSIGELQAGF